MDHNRDEILFYKLSQGDVGAFEELFQQRRQQIFKFIVMYTKSTTVAEELTQEVFIRLWKSRASINMNQNPKSYLNTIAKNLALNYLRSQTKQARLKEELWERSQRFSSNPEDQLVFKDYQAIFNSILEELPQKKRDIYVLSKHHGKTHDEIATELGLSKKTVKNNLWEAFKLIRTRLEPYLEYTIKFIIIAFSFFNF